jgi:ABC-2 type transport system ATP-binding protein
MDFAIRTTALTRKFGDYAAVDGIDLEVPAGSFYGFLGPNGAGKSTTLKCLVGLLRPTSGEIRILGIDPVADPVGAKRAMGIVPEGAALLDRLTAAETLAFVAQVRGIAPAVARSRADDLLALFELAAAGDSVVAEYSHGMRKKLALAVAMLPSPPLLVLDEPFEGIDPISSSQIKRVLHEYVARGGTVLLTSHILEIVEKVADRIGVLVRGKLVAQDTLDALSKRSRDGTLESVFQDTVGEAPEARSLAWLAR